MASSSSSTLLLLQQVFHGTCFVPKFEQATRFTHALYWMGGVVVGGLTMDEWGGGRAKRRHDQCDKIWAIFRYPTLAQFYVFGNYLRVYFVLSPILKTYLANFEHTWAIFYELLIFSLLGLAKYCTK